MSNVYTKINVRSPYILTQAGSSAGQTVKLDLYLHNGGVSEPASATYSLSKKTVAANLLNVHFDISPYLKSYITHTSLTPVTGLTATAGSMFCYCKAILTLAGVAQTPVYFIGYDGFGYFEDGANPVLDAHIMLDEGEYYLLKDENYGALFYSIDSDVSPAQDWDATYVCLDGTTADVNIDLNAQDNGHIPYIPPTHKGNGSTLKIFKDSALYKTFTFTEVCEPKYTPVICDFINRFGAWQTIIFFKVSKSKIDTTSSKFKMMPSSVSYNTSKNITQVFNVNGQESITVNTGFVREGYGDVIKQLLLSEIIRLDNRPVNVNTKSLNIQKSINDGLINYTLDFQYANPIINNIQ
jgi:hypothetical protein|tara:strand:- start:722 stop:1780 length:1059 start_codon:yes stop_codon:yes gene_type:complete